MIETAAYHTNQLYGGDINIDIGTMIALPPRINLFLLLEPLLARFHSLCNFSAGGRRLAFLYECKIVHMELL